MSAKESDPHWMEKAFANSHGQVRAKAKRAGESTAQFVHEKHSGKTAKQTNLVKTVEKINHRRGR